jgi:class 3 adenylate cyclase
VAYLSWLEAIDVSPALSSLSVPTLVLHREDVQWIPIDAARQGAHSVRGARFVTVPGADMTPFTEPYGQILAEIEEFLTGLPATGEPERTLATVVFSDIVGSTARAVELGDRRWRNLLATHDALSITIVEQHRGRVIKQTGDGFLATFDGPGKAIRCSLALRDALTPIGLQLRIGIHTGEIELRGDDIGGIGVHIAARVGEHARPGQLLTSAAVPLLVAGSGIDFEDQGEHELKGIPGVWRLFSVAA